MKAFFRIMESKKRLLLNDIKAVAAAINKTDKFEDYEALSKIEKKLS